MDLLEVYTPEIQSYVRYKRLSYEDVDTFVEEYSHLKRDDYVRKVLDTVIFNLRSEVSGVLRSLKKKEARAVLAALYNGAVMLNPGLDVDEWIKISYPKTLKEDGLVSTANEISPPTAETKAKKRKPPPKRITRAKFLGLEAHLRENIIGQNEAISSVVKSLKRTVTGLGDEERPLGVFLFAGSSGTGKSELAKQLNSYLFGEDADIVRIDCGEYQHKHENQKLIGCFPPGSQVQMADGTSRAIEDVSVGDEVVTHLGKMKPVIDRYEYDSPDELIELQAMGIASPVISTKKHEYLAVRFDRQSDNNVQERTLNRWSDRSLDNPSFEWVAAEDLQKRDWVLVPRPRYAKLSGYIYDLVDYFPAGKNYYKYDEKYVWSQEDYKVNRFIKVDEKFASLAGFYVSEGGSSKSKKTFNFTMNILELSYVEEIASLVEDIFGISTYRLEDRSDRNSWRIHFYSKVVTTFLASIMGENTWAKKVPREIVGSDDKVKYKFLESSIIGDGCTKIQGRADYSTVSYDLFTGLSGIMRSLGLDIWWVKEEPKEKEWSTRYRIYISGNSLGELSERTALDVKLSKWHGREQCGIRSGLDYTFHRVRSTEVVNRTFDKVYDISVDGDNSYTVAGVAVHNSPPGYVGHDEGGHLTNQMKKNSHTVVLLDEVEKAHPDMWNTFLRVFDEGFITDGTGKQVSFRNSIIVMTTNLGNRETVADLLDGGVGFGSNLNVDFRRARTPKREVIERHAEKAIHKHFRPEFLNRIDCTVVFNYLTHEDLTQIARLELGHLESKLKKKGVSLTYDDSVTQEMISEGVNPVEGARGLARVRREGVEDAISDALLNSTAPRGSVVSVSFVEDEYSVNIKRPQRKRSKSTK